MERAETQLKGHHDPVIPSVDWPPFLRSLRERLQAPDAQLIYRLRNSLFSIPSPWPEVCAQLCVKSFTAASLLNSLNYKRKGSKAERSFRYAQHLRNHGVGAPAPLGYAERWQGSRLTNSYFISEFAEDITDLKSEMVWLLHERPDCHSFLALFRTAILEVRKMHDCGFQHNDLGMQNIILRRAYQKDGQPHWHSVAFIDLNRGSIHKQLNLRQRARDLCKLEIPSHLRRIIFHAYFADGPIPAGFRRWERFYRTRISWHNASRKYRHPIRHIRHLRTQILTYKDRPDYRDMWLWDDKTGQPCVILDREDRSKYRTRTDVLPLVKHNLLKAPEVWRTYRRLLPTAYQSPVDMRGRIGASVEPYAQDWPRQLTLLDSMPGIPLVVRCYHHLGNAGIARCEEAMRDLQARGHEILLALVQCRKSALEPQSWQAFLAEALAHLHPYAQTVEIGHAVNRVKWGLWNFREIHQLWDRVGELKQQYPHLKILGPAVNDFEYHYYPPILAKVADKIDGLSCHLYVDRRGAPENFQGPFSLLEKCALGKAMALAHDIPGFYSTETNWPIKGTDIYSPIACPYVFPGTNESKLHVDEATYAAYMVRYYLIALCSGFCERVWWWRLISHGFGLASDVDSAQERPALLALSFLHKSLANSQFLRYQCDNAVHSFYFTHCLIRYATSPSPNLPIPNGKPYHMTGHPISPNLACKPTGEPVFWIYD